MSFHIVTCRLSVLATCLLFTACGGGGGSNNPPPNATASGSLDPTSLDGSYIGICDNLSTHSERETGVTTGAISTDKTEYYGNTSCSGLPAATVLHPQAVLSIQGATIISGLAGSKVISSSAGGAVTFLGIAVDNGNGTHSIPFVGETVVVRDTEAAYSDKDIAVLKDGKLYGGDKTQALDSDGYPTVLDMTRYLVKQ